MANNMSSRQACHAARYVVARVLRGLFWCLKYTVILPLATMALMALFVLWKDDTTPGKLLVKEINFVRQTAPAGQFPVSECWFSSSDSSGRSEIQDTGRHQYNASDCGGTTGNGPGSIEQSRKCPAWVQQQYCQCLEHAQSVWF